MKKILFVYPNLTRQEAPQIGLCMLAAVARGLGHPVDFYDLTVIPEGEEVSAFQTKFRQCRPDVLAVSCRSNEWPLVVQLLNQVDRIGILTIVGGPQATVSPEETVAQADVVVLGEGEATFADLLQRLEAGREIADTPGCWVRSGDCIVKNEMRELIADLDSLPMPYWQLFDRIHYEKAFVLTTTVHGAKVAGMFEGSRGCPFACTYCSNNTVRNLYKGKGLWRREKSPERIISEIKAFRGLYGLDCVFFIDEIMLTKLERLTRFRDLYRAEIGLPFMFMERPENMQPEKVALIKDAGAVRAAIGIESGSEHIRRTLLNRKHSQETIVAAFEAARCCGLSTYAFTMVGFPREDHRVAYETYRLLRRVQPDYVQTSIFYPLPGTELRTISVRDGLFAPDTPMQKDYYCGSALNFPERWRKQLLRSQRLLTEWRTLGPLQFRLAQRSRFFFWLLFRSRDVKRKIRTEGWRGAARTVRKKFVNC